MTTETGIPEPGDAGDFIERRDAMSWEGAEHHDCRACRFYRQPTTPSAALEPDVAQFGRPMLEVLEELRRDELEATENEPREAEDKRQARSRMSHLAKTDRWTRRPVRQPYCGIAEADGQYFICEVKNFDGMCGDFEPGTSDGCETCNTCSNHRASVANILLARIREVMSEFTASGGELFEQLNQQYELVSAHQVRTVRRQDGKTTQFVSALPYCNAMSDGTTFVASTLFNISGHCHQFAAGTPRLPEWLDQLVSLYRIAKTTPAKLGTNARNDPRNLAQASFIRAALQVLGLEARSQWLVEALYAAAQVERARDASATARLTWAPRPN